MVGTPTAGLLLAAGGGRRFGRPKALAVTDGVPWAVAGVRRLRAGGCDPVLVVVGAAGDEVIELLPTGVIPVRNPHWEQGMGGSLRLGLEAAAVLAADIDAIAILLVDLPGVTAEMVRGLREVAGPGREVLAQAEFGGIPGHPVLIGRDHWAAVAEAVHGDTGARRYLADHGARRVPLGTLDQGADRDR